MMSNFGIIGLRIIINKLKPCGGGQPLTQMNKISNTERYTLNEKILQRVREYAWNNFYTGDEHKEVLSATRVAWAVNKITAKQLSWMMAYAKRNGITSTQLADSSTNS
jgi:hypothetical protein